MELLNTRVLEINLWIYFYFEKSERFVGGGLELSSAELSVAVCGNGDASSVRFGDSGIFNLSGTGGLQGGVVVGVTGGDGSVSAEKDVGKPVCWCGERSWLASDLCFSLAITC